VQFVDDRGYASSPGDFRLKRDALPIPPPSRRQLGQHVALQVSISHHFDLALLVGPD
jgi:hypothetical protein